MVAAVEKAVPAGKEFELQSLDYVDGIWSLAGQCNDFGCVDSFKAELANTKSKREVKLNSAKQTLRKDAVKFSITVKPATNKEVGDE